jgi:hypothetical protein
MMEAAEQALVRTDLDEAKGILQTILKNLPKYTPVCIYVCDDMHDNTKQ